MPSTGIPLPEIFAAANGLRKAGLIEEYALGGALAAIRYTEPFTTYDADIFFIPVDAGLSARIPGIYAYLQKLDYILEGAHTVLRGFPVRWLATVALTEEAVRKAEVIEIDGVSGRVMRAEHLVAIAASVGRLKDRARIEQMLEQAELDRNALDAILQRHDLNLSDQ